MQNPMRFKIRPAAPSGWRVLYQSKRNGKTILWSEVYPELRDAKYVVALAKRHAATAEVVVVPPAQRRAS
jgi:uncharacterized protein YegP (UPF0339 family)